MEQIDEASIRTMRATYRAVRNLVYEEATRPTGDDRQCYEGNKRDLKQQVTRVCADANLDLVSAPDELSRLRLWHHLWTKNRYAGIRAAIASKEIEDITDQFCNYRLFGSSQWDLVSKGQEAFLAQSGEMVRSFMQRTGPFTGKQTIGNVPKLRKIIAVARAFAVYADERPFACPISFVIGDNCSSDVWSIHRHLMGLGYTADLTALHCMMDLGFEVIKPDIVISRLFLKLGWLHKITCTLPTDLTANDLLGNGAHGRRYLYFRPAMYRPIIDLARLIVSDINNVDLIEDIGWATDNKLREFDLMMVKFGQLPEPRWGIERRLSDTIDIRTIADEVLDGNG